MDVFNRQGDALIWARKHETLQVEADAPLDRIPLYLRDGAQLAIRG
jgi:hypothetical protein